MQQPERLLEARIAHDEQEGQEGGVHALESSTSESEAVASRVVSWLRARDGGKQVGRMGVASGQTRPRRARYPSQGNRADDERGAAEHPLPVT